jgi:hypothetical protein
VKATAPLRLLVGMVAIVLTVVFGGSSAARSVEDYANPSVRLSRSPAFPRPGQRIVYVATIKNNGTLPAPGVRVGITAEIVPHGRSIYYGPRVISVSTSRGACARTGPGFALLCRLGALGPGEIVSVRAAVVAKAPSSCTSGQKVSGMGCTLKVTAGLNYEPAPGDNSPRTVGPFQAANTVRFAPARPSSVSPPRVSCSFPNLPGMPQTRACYSVRIRANEASIGTRHLDLRKQYNCAGAPVFDARVSQRITIESNLQPLKVFGNFPSLLTWSGGKASATGYRDAPGLSFPSRVTIVRTATGRVLEDEAGVDPATVCAGGPVPARKLVNADCGKRAFASSPVILTYNGPGQFKTYFENPWQPYRQCELLTEAGGGELVEWRPIYKSVALGQKLAREKLTRRRFYRTRVGQRFVVQGGYVERHTFGVERGSVALTFTRLS